MAQTRSTGRRAVAAVVSLALSGCAVLSNDSVPEPTTAAQPPVVASPALSAPPVAEPTAPRAARSSPQMRAAERHEIVIVFDDATAEYADVAIQIADVLGPAGYRVELASVQTLQSPATLAELRGRELLAVAVGLEAVVFAREQLSGPLIFCQVFNYQDLFAPGERVWGVHSVPPLTLQFAAWKALDPSLRRIGVIVSEAHLSLVGEAVQAAGPAAIEIRSEVSASDRETLYLFKRLAPDVDGLWLLPDNRILSPAVLQELLTYALMHGVGVLVLNESLLPWGALLSATSTTADIAGTVHRVVESVISGRTQELPAMTPLAEVELRVNGEVATQLGLTGAPVAPWVSRAFD